MLKKLVLSIFLVLTSTLSAQRLFDNSHDFDLFHHYTRWGVQLDGLGFFPGYADPVKALSFETQYALGYKFGVVYNINLNNHFGFKIGALAGQIPAIKTYFVLSPAATGQNVNYEHKKTVYSPVFNYSFPILFEYRNFIIDRYTLSFATGVHIEHTAATGLKDTYQNFYQTTANNPGKWDVDLIFKVGWYFQFKPVMLQTSIVYKYRLNDQYTGTYQFKNIQNLPDTSGNYILKGDYIGLSFNFYFHRRAREVAMSCRAHAQSKEVRKRQELARREKEKRKKQQEKIRKKKEKKLRQKTKKKWIFW